MLFGMEEKRLTSFRLFFCLNFLLLFVFLMLLGKKENVILKLEIRSSSQRKKKKKNAKAYAEYTRSEASNPYIIYILFRLICMF